MYELKKARKFNKGKAIIENLSVSKCSLQRIIYHSNTPVYIDYKIDCFNQKTRLFKLFDFYLKAHLNIC